MQHVILLLTQDRVHVLCIVEHGSSAPELTRKSNQPLKGRLGFQTCPSPTRGPTDQSTPWACYCWHQLTKPERYSQITDFQSLSALKVLADGSLSAFLAGPHGMV